MNRFGLEGGISNFNMHALATRAARDWVLRAGSGKHGGSLVEYRLYQGEGHVITQAPNVIDFWNRRLDFLREHLDLVCDAKGAIIFDGERARSRGARASGR